MEQVDADVGNFFAKIDSWVDGFFKLLPNMGIALVVLVVFWLLARGVGWAVRRAAHRQERDNLGEVGASLIGWAVLIGGIMLSVTIVLPSISPGDLFAGLGIGSVAIGFAFKDILQNMLAGILILIRQPFSIGDQIVSGSYEGTVEQIETRATLIKTYDGRRVVIPNTDIYTDAVIVNTAFDIRRSEYDVQIGCNDDWDRAIKIMQEVCAGVEGVKSDPPPEALPWAIADSGNDIRLRWWTDSARADVVHTFSRVIKAVYQALDKAGIDMPYPTQVVLFHDQTEETDGVRSKQREGWPTTGNDPKTRRISDALEQAGKDHAAAG